MTRIHVHNLYIRDNAYLYWDASSEIVIIATPMFVKVIKLAEQYLHRRREELRQQICCSTEGCLEFDGLNMWQICKETKRTIRLRMRKRELNILGHIIRKKVLGAFDTHRTYWKQGG